MLDISKSLSRELCCFVLIIYIMGSQLRWLERTPDKREVDGSIPFEPTKTDLEISFSTLKNIQINITR